VYIDKNKGFKMDKQIEYEFIYLDYELMDKQEKAETLAEGKKVLRDLCNFVVLSAFVLLFTATVIVWVG
tara:strand:- start:2266 stop:2472 length:207 start_codon:yes stop_codon:yes gene_type:complete